MNPALLVRLRPLGPWRYGPGDGGLDRVDTLYRSDRLFSALTIAMRQLAELEEWLDATALSAEPALAISSLFPFQGDTLFAVPPATLWPPPSHLVSSPSQVFLAKIRWKTAHFVPLSVIDALTTGQKLLADQWLTDGESGCLLRRDRPNASPFRFTLRRSASVDRLGSGASEPTPSGCVEFEPGAGLWTIVRYRSSQAEAAWNSRVEAAFRLLADSGFGGRRSSGWGQTQSPEFERGRWPSMLLPKAGRASGDGARRNGERGEGDGKEDSRFWLLSLYSPSASDQVNWTRGEYHVTVRSGFVDGAEGNGGRKKSLRMISEGSVLEAPAELVGAAVNVAPDGAKHPVFRSGIALAFELSSVTPTDEEEVDRLEMRAVEEPQTEEAVTAPCDVEVFEPTAEEPSPAEELSQAGELSAVEESLASQTATEELIESETPAQEAAIEENTTLAETVEGEAPKSEQQPEETDFAI